jgi:hypothetical protein
MARAAVARWRDKLPWNDVRLAVDPETAAQRPLFFSTHGESMRLRRVNHLTAGRRLSMATCRAAFSEKSDQIKPDQTWNCLWNRLAPTRSPFRERQRAGASVAVGEKLRDCRRLAPPRDGGGYPTAITRNPTESNPIQPDPAKKTARTVQHPANRRRSFPVASTAKCPHSPFLSFSRMSG